MLLDEKGVKMPRIARRKSKSIFNHIMVQGTNKEYIFKHEKEMKKYQNIIIEKLKKTDIEILAYCIMNNHAHFLIYSEKQENLSKFMQRINTSYSRWYNKENKRVGYVFRDRFYLQEILDERQLFNCLRYIHNNPVKAKIVNKMDDYKYSSYNEFLKDKKIISNESIKLIFGSVENYKNRFLCVHNKYLDENFIDAEDAKQSLTDYIKTIEKKYNKKIDQMYNDKNLIKIIINEAREQTNATIKEIAGVLKISKSTVGRYVKK